MNKLIMMILMMFCVVSCGVQGKAEVPTPIIDQLVEETVAFVTFSQMSNTWRTYCGGVWVDAETILTANHCAIAAKMMGMSEEEKIMAILTGEKPVALNTKMSFADSTAFDVMEKGASKHYDGIVIAEDKEHDLALIHAISYPAHRYAILSNDKLNVGDEVKVMGHPAGVEFTYTHGYISAFRSDIDQEAMDIKGPFLQINAGISGGNSGGGVFNSKGELIGIISFVKGRAVVQAFAIPLVSIRGIMGDKYGIKLKK